MTLKWPKGGSVSVGLAFGKIRQKIAGSNPFQKTHNGLVSWDQWDGFSDLVQNCPFTSKSDLALDRKANPPYGTKLTFPGF